MSSKLKPGRLSKIRYTKGEEITERHIIPTLVPLNIKAIDVTSLPLALREKIAAGYSEYLKYLDRHMKTAFSFEDWFEYSKNIELVPKWRTFKPDQTDIL